MQVIQKTV